MASLEELRELSAPLIPGLATAGLLLVMLVLLRFLFRREGLTQKLRLPVNLLLLYLLFAALVLAAAIYLPPIQGALHLVGLLVLALAVVLAVSFGLFDLFLGRYRKIRVPTIVRDIVVIVVYAITIIFVLGRHGVNLTSIVTTSAVLTAVIGFALQDLLSNIISGIALQLERPFTSGDWVMFGEQEGWVLEINWRSTKIQTLHNDIVIIPNNVITRASLINLSSPSPIHRRKLKLGLRYETPPNEAKASILRAVRAVDGVLSSPEPYVLLRGYEESCILYRIHFYIDNIRIKDRIEDEVYTRLWYQLRRDGHSIPFPIRDVNVRRMDAEEERQREHELSQIERTLQKVPVLQVLTAEECRQLAGQIKREHYATGETIIKEGDPGDCLYIIAAGDVTVQVGPDETVVSALHQDDFFGEMSLMTGESRTATIIAAADCELYVVDKEAFETIVRANEALVEAIGLRLHARRDELANSQRPQAPDTATVPDEAASLVTRIRRFFSLE